MERVSTGNVAVDQILQGGFPAGSINILMGPPGSGKTTFVQQLAFKNVVGDRPVLYLTTVSEPLGKLLTYLQEYTFTDPLQIGVKVIYESVAEVLSAHPEKLEEAITALIRQHRPQIIIIDSFKAIGDLMPDRPSWRRALYNLAGMLTAYDATSFWLGEYTPEMVSNLPEFATADGIVDFSREQQGTRDDRYLRVLKLRGSDFLGGYHFFRITKGGLEVFIRLITPRTPTVHQAAHERLTSGVDGLDRMIETGWLRGTTTLVEGPSGAGKTGLGLHFLREGVACGEATLLVSFQESPSQLRRIIRGFGWDAEALIGAGKLDLLYTSPVELQMDSIVTEMFRRVESHGVRRVVIDAIGDMEKSARDPHRFRDYLYTLGQHFAVRDVTAMFMMERRAAHDAVPGAATEISPMSDNTLLLGMNLGEDLGRTIQVIKSRGSAHDGRRHTFKISAKGLSVDAAPRKVS
jgi:circadian clock protein KaiC